MISLVAGLNAALLRLGLQAPVGGESLASMHGLLMVYGFLGTAITLERAVALQSSGTSAAQLAYLAPAASVAAVVASLAQIAWPALPDTRWLPAAAWAASMIALIGIYLAVWGRAPSFAVLVQILGAVSGLVGMLLWGRGLEVALIVPWWAAFLVLTIIGERLELARVAFASTRTGGRILAESLVVLVGLVLTLFVPDAGYPFLGAALLILVVDVALHDVARRLVRGKGLTRFMATCMMGGYAWALVAAGMWIVRGPTYSGYPYDTVVHALTIGFALSMVLAHAPVIVPAIARRDLPYHPVMWAVWGALQAGLLIRVVAGARDAQGAWQFGGALDIAAVLAFVASTVALIVLSAGNASPFSRSETRANR